MKLGKNEIMAIVESALFLLGAIFMAIVFIVPSNPLWAFIIGLLLALIGVGLWVAPLIINLVKKQLAEKRESTLTATTVAEATTTDQNYELHRPVAQPAAPTTPTNPSQPADNHNSGVDLDF